MKKLLEKDIQKSILDYLRFTGWMAFKVPSIGTFVKATGSYIPSPLKGCADILAFKKGYPALAVECKRPKGKQSEFQIAWQEDFEAHGGYYILATSIDDIQQEIR